MTMRACLVAMLIACQPTVAADPEPEPAPEAEPTASAAAPSVEAEFADGIDQIVRKPAEIEWGPCPPGPLQGDGCQMAVLEGNPKSAQLFTLRVRTTEPFVLPAHSHPANERVTVLEGALQVGFADEVDKAKSTRFEVGDYYVNRAGAHHFVWSDEPMLLQITGIGPWKIEPVQTGEH
ncbi:MAG: cupin domain-containing protein [Proteobacteria bacterium]|nr:cupin domain-containing protein [Pseudomonadota bacterium]